MLHLSRSIFNSAKENLCFMPSRFSKMLKRSTACCLASSLVVGVGGSQVFAKINFLQIHFFVENLLRQHINYKNLGVNDMDEETCKEIYRMTSYDNNALLALGIFVASRSWEKEVKPFLIKAGLIDEDASRTDRRVVDLLKLVFKEIKGADFLKFIAAFNEGKVEFSDNVTLIKELISSVGEENFLNKVTSRDHTLRYGEGLRTVKEGYEWACRLLKEGPSGAECRLPKAFSGRHSDFVYWKEVFTKALSFDGVQKDLENQKNNVSKLNRELADTRSALFPTAILLSFIGAPLFSWLIEIGNSNSREKGDNSKKN